MLGSFFACYFKLRSQLFFLVQRFYRHKVIQGHHGVQSLDKLEFVYVRDLSI